MSSADSPRETVEHAEDQPAGGAPDSGGVLGALNLGLSAVASCAVFLFVRSMLASLVPGMSAGNVLDPDSHARLLRVEQLMSGGGWYDNHLSWANAPYGTSMHWTRAFDALIALSSFFFPGSDQRTSIVFGGSLVPVLLGVATITALIWGFRNYLGPRSLILVGLLAGVQPFLSHYFERGYIDHHSLITLLFAVGWAALVLSLDDREPVRSRARIAGIACGIAVWVSIESLLWILVLAGAIALLWVMEGAVRYLTGLTTMFRSAAVVAAFGFVLERDPRRWLVFEPDRISLLHVVFIAGIAAGWAFVSRAGFVSEASSSSKRIAVATVVFAVPGIAIGLLFPPFLQGPLADVDPRVIPILFENNAEFQPLTFDGPAEMRETGMTMIPVVLAVLASILGLRSRRPAMVRLAIVTLSILVVFVPLTFYQMRWSSYAGIVSILPWAITVRGAWRWMYTGPVWKRILRAPFAIGFATYLAVANFSILITLDTIYLWRLDKRRSDGSSPVSKSERRAGTPVKSAPVGPRPGLSRIPGRCSYAGIGQFLSNEARRDRSELVVMTTMFEGPQLVWETGATVVGAPYHRNAGGIIDTETFMANPDLDAARSVVDHRDVDFVVICRAARSLGTFSRTSPRGLAMRLATGASPDWLEPMSLPEEADPELRVYAVRARGGSQ